MDLKLKGKVAFIYGSTTRTGIERFASANEIANPIVYDSSELASSSNRATIRVEGGLIRSIL